jgi:hypothetical protein
MKDHPGPGHNLPPEWLVHGEEYALLRQRTDELIENANRWLKERPEIVTEEQAGDAQTFTDQLVGARDDLDALKAKECEPFDTEITMIRKRYSTPTDLVELALSLMRAKAGVWLQKKRDRLAAEQAERVGAARKARDDATALARIAVMPGASVEDQLAAKRAEADAVQAEKDAGKKPTRVQIKSDYSSRAMSLREVWHARIVDETKALDFFCHHGGTRAALLAVALKEANRMAAREKRVDAAPAGVEFFTTEKAL